MKTISNFAHAVVAMCLIVMAIFLAAPQANALGIPRVTPDPIARVDSPCSLPTPQAGVTCDGYFMNP